MLFKLIFVITIMLTVGVWLSACQSIQDGPPPYPIDVSTIPNAKPRALPKSRYGNPRYYVANGRRYHVLSSVQGYHKQGWASWYGIGFNGHLTSSREPYNMLAMTAASPVLPIPCFVRVTNLFNGRSVIVKVNDRGPFAPHRIIDLSYVAARKLRFTRVGTAWVDVQAISTARHPPIPRRHTRLWHKSAHIYLQLGAFSQYGYAKRLQTRVQDLTGYLARIIKIYSANHVWFKVQLGPFRNGNEFNMLKKRLRQSHYQAVTLMA